MKKKFENAFKALVKDFGLSDKAIAELVEQGQAVIDDDATEELVQSQANLYANIAKITQGEVTRKVQAVKQQPATPKSKAGDNTPPAGTDGNSGGSGNQEKPKEQDNVVLNQLRAMQEQLAKLQEVSEQTAREKAEAARKSIVQEAAKKVGIDEGMIRLYNTADLTTAAEAEKFFTEVKQLQVNSNLPQKGLSIPIGSSDEADKAAAEAWANKLPDKK